MKTEILTVDPQYPDLEKIAKCAKIIKDGGLVIFPTETVYGIAADYLNPKAMERLYKVKQRSADKPFSLLISQLGLVANYTSMSDPALFKLISAYWPGPLTIVVPAKEGEGTIGIRMPDNAIALKLLQEVQSSIAAPSANIERNPAPVTCAEALKDLDGLVDCAIDGGPADIGSASSVIDLTQETPQMIREGVISEVEMVKTINRKVILFVCTGNSCRSVMAEYILKDTLKGRDDVLVISAGTGVFIQSTASSETISVLQQEGVDATGHISTSLNSITIKQSDLIFVMTRSHRSQVLERVPSVEKRVYLLREFSGQASGFQTDLDIPDPIGRSHHEYKECLAVIKESIHKIVELI